MSFAHFVLDGGGRGRRLRNWAKEHSLSLLMRRTEQNLSLSGQETEGRLCGVKYSDKEGLIEGYFRPSCLQRHKKVTTAHRGVGEGGARKGGGRPKSPGNAKNKVRSRILPSIILTPLSQSQLYSCSFASHSRLFCAIRHGAYKRRLCLPLRRVVACFAVFGVERWGNLPAALAQDACSLAPLPNPNAAGRNAPTGANERREEGGRGNERGRRKGGMESKVSWQE